MTLADSVTALVKGLEAQRLELLMSKMIEPETRESIWSAAEQILRKGHESMDHGASATGLALGYVQSGKTTAMTALMAAAADDGYSVVIAFLGSTNLLLEQNEARIEGALGISTRTDYKWVSLRNPSGVHGAKELRDWLGKSRVTFLPVLKHAGRIDALANVVRLAVPATARVLIVDDEADQASLNTRVKEAEESRVYAAIRRLRDNLPPHLYVQYTATPYAPLLLEPKDHLLPNFVTFLQPGRGYTGGREFFVDHEKQVIRPIPALDEQPPKKLPTELPKSLVLALANYIVGAGMLLENKAAQPPISMLVHSTQRNDVQARYFFLLERLLKAWRAASENALVASDLPMEMREERKRLVQAGALDISDEAFLSRVRYVLRETKPWLVNSQSAVRKINWNVAPCHIVVGGNKLDRGFTVEGLTVTYMNRATTSQIDTLEQRARAFGYRSDLLPYCQFFATPRTLKVLRDIVFTEYDLRARLQDWLTSGGSVESWANQVGLMLSEGSRPSRENVLAAINTFNATSRWHSLRRPSLDPAARRHNLALIEALGMLDAPPARYGRLSHRTSQLELRRLIDELLEKWRFSSYSPDWRHQDIIDFLDRQTTSTAIAPVLLLELEPNVPRRREWDEQTGFVNLFQGPDPAGGSGAYPGDRYILGLEADPSQIIFEIHHVTPKAMEIPDLYTIAVHLGDKTNVRRGNRVVND